MEYLISYNWTNLILLLNKYLIIKVLKTEKEKKQVKKQETGKLISWLRMCKIKISN